MQITTIFVTHDQEEAFDLADRVVIMKDGRICQEGSPIDIYRNPADPFVHEFLGESNHVPVLIRSHHVRAADGVVLGQADLPDGAATLFIRPHHVVPVPAAQGKWRVARMTAAGAQARLTLTHGALSLDAAMTADALLESGLQIGAAAELRLIGGTIFADGRAGPIRLGHGMNVIA